MAVARYAQVLRETYIGAHFESVVAMNLGHVINELELAFCFRERAVALVDAERVTEQSLVADRVIDIEGRQARSVRGVRVQARDTRGQGRFGAIAVRNVEDVV